MMYYPEYTIGGELYHSNTATGKAYKYIDKVRTKSGKWRYIYQKYIRNRHHASELNDYKPGKYSKDDPDMPSYRKKGFKATAVRNVSKMTDESLKGTLDALKQSVTVSKNNMRSLSKPEYEEERRKLQARIDNDEMMIKQIEKELQYRHGNVKFGRQR